VNPARVAMRSRCALAGAVLALALAGIATATPTAFKAGVFDPPRQAPDFTLQGTNGHELTLSRYRGKVVLLAFGYSSCPGVCPVTLATFASARRKLGAAAADVQVVYVTVDPERDEVGRLKQFLAGFDNTFIGGTGTQTQLAAVRKVYGISATKIPMGDSYLFSHSSFVYLIDRAGKIRALMPYGHSADDFVNDLKILLRE
jgi:protein SCO1/2